VITFLLLVAGIILGLMPFSRRIPARLIVAVFAVALVASLIVRIN
jgi:uncharacterized membrane protein HdeD (DUF308 family)